MQIHGWGRYPTIDAGIFQPDKLPTTPCIPRGMGRSYGDSSLAPQVISTRPLDLLLDFNAATGQLCCGAGVSLAELLTVFVPRGWFLPVTPGTQFVSVGGAIASDVHGKNHHLHGCFSEYVLNVELMLADGSKITCSRSQYPDLFHATCGGMGLTGLVMTATLQLQRIQSAFIEQTTLKARCLEEALELFANHHAATYSVAWLDCLATGAALGRSLLMLGEHATAGGLQTKRKPSLSVPFDLPPQLLNTYSIRAFNALYYRRIRQPQSQQRVHYEPFFYPLDGIRHWNRLYGKNGFLQYQFVIPKATGIAGLQMILQRIAASERGSFLAVLKAFGAENANLLSFPLEGYTVALDFKRTPDLFGLLDELDAMLLEVGGRLYLTKDARMDKQTFQRGYTRWEQFQQVREQYGAIGRFASLQSRRLGLD